MGELGYFEQIEGGVYGTANPATDSSPKDRYALQEAATQQMILAATAPGAVPQSYQGNPCAGPSNQQLGGPSNLPIIGWTAQKDTGPAFIEPYVQTDMGQIPDWTGDPNPIGAGAYDMQSVQTGLPVDPLNVAPLGGAVLEYSDEPNPNWNGTDDGGTLGRTEY